MKSLYLVGNWKMSGSRALIEAFASSWSLAQDDSLTVAIAPPAGYLERAVDRFPGGLGVAAQDCSAHENGAFTGEMSAQMLAELGCAMVIIGHSERRQYHGESDELIARKLVRARESGLIPILCVGESDAERRAGRAQSVVRAQLQGLSAVSRGPLWIAYEPVWAIGTGLTATPEQAGEMHASIRSELAALWSDDGLSVPILYGGSVKPDNALALFSQPEISGALVGGASLELASFHAIAEAALASRRG